MLKPGVDFAPSEDRKGQALKPGDKVSFKTYPKGTGKGVVVVSKRGQVKYDGKWLPALSIDSEGTLYPLNSKGVLKLKEHQMSISDLLESVRARLTESAPDIYKDRRYIKAYGELKKALADAQKAAYAIRELGSSDEYSTPAKGSSLTGKESHRAYYTMTHVAKGLRDVIEGLKFDERTRR